MASNVVRIALLLVGASLSVEQVVALPFVPTKTSSNTRPVSIERPETETIKWDWKDLVKVRGGFQLLDDYQQDEAMDYYGEEDYYSDDDDEEDDYAYDFTEGVTQPSHAPMRPSAAASSPFLDNFQGEVHNLVNDFREDVRKIFLQLKEGIVLHRATVKAAKEAQKQKKQANDTKDTKKSTEEEVEKRETTEQVRVQEPTQTRSKEPTTPPVIHQQVPPSRDPRMVQNIQTQVSHVPPRQQQYQQKPVPIRGGYQVPGNNQVPQQPVIQQRCPASHQMTNPPVQQQTQQQVPVNRQYIASSPPNQHVQSALPPRPLQTPFPNQRPPSTFQEQNLYRQSQTQQYQARGYSPPTQNIPRSFQQTTSNSPRNAPGHFQGY